MPIDGLHLSACNPFSIELMKYKNMMKKHNYLLSKYCYNTFAKTKIGKLEKIQKLGKNIVNKEIFPSLQIFSRKKFFFFN